MAGSALPQGIVSALQSGSACDFHVFSTALKARRVENHWNDEAERQLQNVIYDGILFFVTWKICCAVLQSPSLSLTLLTCTIGGKSRLMGVPVKCAKCILSHRIGESKIVASVLSTSCVFLLLITCVPSSKCYFVM